jgi:hypothetical protein
MEVVVVSKEGKSCVESQTEQPSGSRGNADTKSTGGDEEESAATKRLHGFA